MRKKMNQKVWMKLAGMGMSVMTGCADAALTDGGELGARMDAVYQPSACTGRDPSSETPVEIADAAFVVSSVMDAPPAGHTGGWFDEEYCWVGPGLAHLRDARRQVRVEANGQSGLCTVNGVHAIDEDGDGTPDDDVVALSTAGFADRFRPGDGEDSFDGRMATFGDDCGWVTTPIAEASVAPVVGVLGEFWDPGPSASFVAAFTAPHGGNIERLTDRQIDYIRDNFTGDFGLWSVVGNRHSQWHASSDDVTERSFFGLRQIADGSPTMVASFHGHAGVNSSSDCYDDVVVGGAVASAFRHGVRRAIELEMTARGVSPALRVRVAGAADADPEDCHGGFEEGNFANRLSLGGNGLQVEQSAGMRDADQLDGTFARTESVAAAVTRYVMAYADPQVANWSYGIANADAPRGEPVLGAVVGVPPGWRVDDGWPRPDHNFGFCWYEGDRGRVDFYGRSADGSLVWHGGGEIECEFDWDYWGIEVFLPQYGFQHLDFTNTTGSTQPIWAIITTRERPQNELEMSWRRVYN